MEAEKNTVENYEFNIKSEEVTEREHCGPFEIIKTKRGIMFKTYTGYHVWTTPYAVGTDGKAHETSLYKCLDEFLLMARTFKGHEDEELTELNGEKGITKGDLLETERIVIEANLTRPMVVFTDHDLAYKEAANYIDWLKSQIATLEKASTDAPPKDDDKANVVFNAKVENAEQIQVLIKEETNAREG